MNLEEIRRALTDGGYYSAELDDGFLRIRNSETDSEWDLEPIEQSIQIRQAVRLDCDGLPEDALSRIYQLCSLMNGRFSGCKSFIDQWGTLVTGADILGPDIAIASIETVLGQVEFISFGMLDLLETMQAEQRLVTDNEIDAALEVPSLQ